MALSDEDIQRIKELEEQRRAEIRSLDRQRHLIIEQGTLIDRLNEIQRELYRLRG